MRSAKSERKTATELAEQLRLCQYLHYSIQINIINVDLMLLSSPSAEGLLPSAYSNAKTILESRQSKIDTNNYP